MRAFLLSSQLLVVVSACGYPALPPVGVDLTIDKRLAVYDVSNLELQVSSAGATRVDHIDIGDSEFPTTLAVEAPGSSSAFDIGINAFDTQGMLVGLAKVSVDVRMPDVAVMLDSVDFVVNTTYANSQFLSNDFEAAGLQLGARPGSWTVAFREDCTSPCNVLARRFDPAGRPLVSALAAGDAQFAVSTMLITAASIAAVASSGSNTLVVWDFTDPAPATTQGIACRAIDDQGGTASNQMTLSADMGADVVTAASLSDGNVAVTWQMFMSTQVIRGVIVKPDCTTLGTPYTISLTGGTSGARRSHVASSGASVLYAWIVDGSVHTRYGSNSGALLGNEATAIAATATEDIDHVRLAPWGTGFAAAVRWSQKNNTGPGKIEVYRIPATGTAPTPSATTAPILITDQSGSDFLSNKAFGVAQRSDGALLVAWHACGGVPGSCEVYGRILRPTGVPVGEPFVIATTTDGDQINPSVVAVDALSFAAAWNDSSLVPPDQSGSSVRARMLYPVYDEARGILGAACGASAEGAPGCGDGLACATGTDSVQRCFAICTPPSCPRGGTCSAVDSATSACIF